MGKKLFYWFTVIPLLALLAVGCSSEPPAVTCESSLDCAKGETCLRGACVPNDNDKDGYAKGEDCDDNNKDVHPGAPELCDNNIDDNCNGKVDEAGCRCKEKSTRPCGSDVGECKKGTQTCVNGEWTECKGAVEPKPEICDGKDNDCDGLIDEDLKKTCYTGDPVTRGRGICHDGIQTCKNGSWGDCIGEQKPQDETCDGRDNNCDGSIDEGCECKKGESRACYGGPKGTLGIGPCKSGQQLCKDGRWGACKDQVLPEAEKCDNIDNDCDGLIDNGITRKCYDGPKNTADIGACKSGIQRCQNGKWGQCIGSLHPSQEVCDGIDNDCDGTVDENLTRECYTGPPNTEGVGECKKGKQLCQNGKWGQCKDEVVPTKEVCDNKDNDCDGQIDENVARPCFTGPSFARNKGLCKEGVQTCSQGAWGKCTGQVLPEKELCDGKDNDCDGTIDEGCQCRDGETRSCYGGPASTLNVGNCQRGTQTCKNGVWSTCKGQVLPEKEVCDGKDNDCDGLVDESLTKPCYTGPKNTAGIGACKLGRSICKNGQWGQCTGEGKPSQEVCNGVDDDCDGQTDEGLVRPCYAGPKGTAGVGICKNGTQTCTGGEWGKCVNFVGPSVETCNNKDDDCNGLVDDGISRSCYTGPQKTLGVGICKSGKSVCHNGKFGPCTNQILPQKEVCNKKDDDCDGTIDEGCNTGSCNLGDTRCRGDKLEKCDKNGAWVVDTVCKYGCANGQCKKKTICIPYEKRCNGLNVEVCSQDGTTWLFREACLKACQNGACQGDSCIPFTLSATPKTLRADGKSTALIVSSVITGQKGNPVPDGTLFTISVTKGSVVADDGDPNLPGLQVRSVNGRIDFAIKGPDLTKAEVVAIASNLPKQIPDFDKTGITINLPVSGLVNKVITLQAELRITHPRVADLDIILISPQGTQVYLQKSCDPSTGKCSTAANLNATYPITHKPAQGSFNDFKGQSGNGTWKLKLIDPYFGPRNAQGGVDAGKLEFFKLSFNAAAITSGKTTVQVAHAKAPSCKATLELAYTATATRTTAEDFTNTAKRDAQKTTVYWDTAMGLLNSFPSDFGTGKDGDLVVNGTYNINRNYVSGRIFPDAVNFAVTELGSNYATLKGGIGGLSIGDEVIIINMQGTARYHANVGNYEIKTISNLDFTKNRVYFNTTIKTTFGNGNNTNLTGQKIVLQRIPHYRNVTINGTLTADAWDGEKGGLLFFKAFGQVTVKGQINMDGKGYRGKLASSGESYHGGYGAAYNNNNQTFGGGANATAGIYPYHANCGWYSCCGWHYKYLYYSAGSGSYGSSGQVGTSHCRNVTSCFTTVSQYQGKTYGSPQLSKWFLGSAGAGRGGYYCRYYCLYSSYRGGHNHYNNFNNYTGGHGGGIIVIWAKGISVTGYIRSNGTNSNNTNYAGGGSGGSIYLRARSLNVGNNRVMAIGGNRAGVGRIRLDHFGLSGTTNPKYYAGFGGQTVAVLKGLNYTNRPVTAVTLLTTLADLRGGAISYEISSDGGKTWHKITPNTRFALPKPAADISMKITFTNRSLDPLALMGFTLQFETQ